MEIIKVGTQIFLQDIPLLYCCICDLLVYYSGNATYSEKFDRVVKSILLRQFSPESSDLMYYCCSNMSKLFGQNMSISIYLKLMSKSFEITLSTLTATYNGGSTESYPLLIYSGISYVISNAFPIMDILVDFIDNIGNTEIADNVMLVLDELVYDVAHILQSICISNKYSNISTTFIYPAEHICALYQGVIGYLSRLIDTFKVQNIIIINEFLHIATNIMM
jgi:hypothetical protein